MAGQEVAVKAIWTPQPKQAALISCPVFEVFFGGARGGGKTEASLGDWAQHASLYGGAATGIFVRRKLVQLSEVIARSKQLYKPLGAKFTEQNKIWTFPNGARLKFVYLERDSDAEEYQGHNYTRVYIEEATNFPDGAPIMKLKATLRGTDGVPTGLRLTGNPGGPGHNWVKHRYIDPAPQGGVVIEETEQLEIDGEQVSVSLGRVFIPSKLTDNKRLLRSDPAYVLRLKQSGSEALVRAWLEGDWSVIDGAFFDEFQIDTHVLNTEKWLPKIPRDALRFRAFDWGSAKPFSVGWFAVSDGTWGLPKGALLRYREWYGSSAPNKGLKLDAMAVAKGIRELERGELIKYGVADPAIFIRNGGPSIAELMASQGCLWRPADNKRVPGWEQVRYRLRGEPSSGPMLFVLDCCSDLLRTLPVLQHDEMNSEDLDTDGEDHAADELRYACMSRPWVPRVSPIIQPSLGLSPGAMSFEQLVNHQRLKRIQANNR